MPVIARIHSFMTSFACLCTDMSPTLVSFLTALPTLLARRDASETGSFLHTVSSFLRFSDALGPSSSRTSFIQSASKSRPPCSTNGAVTRGWIFASASLIMNVRRPLSAPCLAAAAMNGPTAEGDEK